MYGMSSIQFKITSSNPSLPSLIQPKFHMYLLYVPSKSHNQPLLGLFPLIRSPNNIQCSVRIMNLVTFSSSSVSYVYTERTSPLQNWYFDKVNHLVLTSFTVGVSLVSSSQKTSMSHAICPQKFYFYLFVWYNDLVS
jgi:hypothetical protein